MFEIELAFLICTTFYKHTCQKNFFLAAALSPKTWKIFRQSWTKYSRKTHFQTPSPSHNVVQCCPNEWKFSGLIYTEVVNTQATLKMGERRFFSKYFVHDCTTEAVTQRCFVKKNVLNNFWEFREKRLYCRPF